MQRTSLIILVILFLTLMSSCTVREELQFGVELRDKNLGFTVENFSMACIVTQQELVDTLSITLVDQNNNTYEEEISQIQTSTEIFFTDVADGSYTSTCIVCKGETCRESESGTVLVSLETQDIDSYEFDVPPSFILGTPIDQTYFLSEQPLLVSFSCLAKDDVGLTAVSLVSNVSGLFAETFIQTPSKSSHLLTKDLVLEPGRYLWTCRATDTRAQTVVAPVRIFTIGAATPDILPNIEGFDGDTTDFSSLNRLTDIPDVVIEDTQFGKITFVDNISSLVGVDLSKGIVITKDSITVNSSLYPQLNVPAKLSFYDVQFDEELEEANIEKDGSTYSVQDLTYEDGELTFTVGNFSTYTVVITPQGGYDLEVGEPEEELLPEEDIVEDEPVVEETDLGILNGTQEDELILGEEQEETQEQNESIDFLEGEEENTSLTPLDETIQDTNETTTSDAAPLQVDPFVIIAIITGFIAIIFLVLWLLRRNSGGAMLRKY